MWMSVNVSIFVENDRKCEKMFIRQTVEVSYDSQTEQKMRFPADGSANLRKRKTKKTIRNKVNTRRRKKRQDEMKWN